MCILRYKPDQYSKSTPTALFRMEDSIGNPLKSQLYIEFPHVSGSELCSGYFCLFI